MKVIIKLLLIIFLKINVLAIDLEQFNKIDNNFYFKITNKECINIGDSIIFYGYSESIIQDPKIYSKFYLFIYHDNILKSIPVEQITNDSFNIPLMINKFFKDKDNNLWFSFDKGLFKLENDSIINFSSKLEENSINTVNSFLIDENQDLWIHSNANIYKWDDTSFVQKVFASKNMYLSPEIFKGDGIQKIGDKIYFKNMMKTLSYYDITNDFVDTISFYPNFKSDGYIISGLYSYENNLYIAYKLGNVAHFAKYDGEQFVNLDNYIDLINDGNILTSNFNFAIDAKQNFYFKINAGNGNPKNDSLYVVDINMKKASYFYKNILLNNELALKYAITLSNNNVYLPSAGAGFLVLKQTTSVESPTNWLFLENIYPNPSKNTINIEFGIEPSNLSKLKVKMFNYLGTQYKILCPDIYYEPNSGKGRMTCNISFLNPGYYFVALSNEKYSKVLPLIVE